MNLDSSIYYYFFLRRPIACCLFASSCSVYGENNDLPLHESSATPKSPYAISKYVNELYAKYFSSICDFLSLDLDSLTYLEIGRILKVPMHQLYQNGFL